MVVASDRADGTGKQTGTQTTPCLTLHIPNSHPRATSPRTSPGPRSWAGQVELPEDEAAGRSGLGISSGTDDLAVGAPYSIHSPRSAPERLEPGPSPLGRPMDGDTGSQQTPVLPRTAEQGAPRHQRTPFSDAIAFFRAYETSGESARDFLARERTFFSWLRLSTMLAIGSAALFLRLQLKDLAQVLKPDPHHRPRKRRHQKDASTRWERALRVRAVRKRAQRQQAVLTSLHQPQALHAGSIDMLHTFSANSALKDSSDVLDTNVLLSEALGGLFFALAIVSLCVGYIDYMRCERALEHADQVVPVVGHHADDGHPNNVERRAVAVRWHDVRHAKQAHSSLYVRWRIIAIDALTHFLTLAGWFMSPRSSSPSSSSPLL